MVGRECRIHTCVKIFHENHTSAGETTYPHIPRQVPYPHLHPYSPRRTLRAVSTLLQSQVTMLRGNLPVKHRYHATCIRHRLHVYYTHEMEPRTHSSPQSSVPHQHRQDLNRHGPKAWPCTRHNTDKSNTCRAFRPERTPQHIQWWRGTTEQLLNP